MTYVYHYHVFYQTMANAVNHADGLMLSPTPICTDTAFLTARNDILVKLLGRRPRTDELENFCVASLTFLHAIPEEKPNAFDTRQTA